MAAAKDSSKARNLAAAAASLCISAVLLWAATCALQDAWTAGGSEAEGAGSTCCQSSCDEKDGGCTCGNCSADAGDADTAAGETDTE